MANGRLRFQRLGHGMHQPITTQGGWLSAPCIYEEPGRSVPKRAGRGEVCWLHVADTNPKRYQSSANLDRLLI
jgi:hypothetical protein